MGTDSPCDYRDYRKTFSGTYGDEALALVGLDVPPAQRFLEVREQALEILERMRDESLVARLPEPRSGQSPVDVAQLADDMEGDVRRLEEVDKAIEKMAKMLDESLVLKREAFERHYRIYLNVARIQEGYYRLVGLDELADRIRTAERSSRSAQSEPAQPSESPAEGEAADGRDAEGSDAEGVAARGQAPQSVQTAEPPAESAPASSSSQREEAS